MFMKTKISAAAILLLILVCFDRANANTNACAHLMANQNDANQLSRRVVGEVPSTVLFSKSIVQTMLGQHLHIVEKDLTTGAIATYQGMLVNGALVTNESTFLPLMQADGSLQVFEHSKEMMRDVHKIENVYIDMTTGVYVDLNSSPGIAEMLKGWKSLSYGFDFKLRNYQKTLAVLKKAKETRSFVAIQVLGTQKSLQEMGLKNSLVIGATIHSYLSYIDALSTEGGVDNGMYVEIMTSEGKVIKIPAYLIRDLRIANHSLVAPNPSY